MKVLKKASMGLSFLVVFLIHMAGAQAAVVGTAEVLTDSKRTQIVNLLERSDVQQQLIAHGVDPVASLARVNEMTTAELVQLNGHIDELTVGAGVSTVQLLLIIIVIILIV